MTGFNRWPTCRFHLIYEHESKTLPFYTRARSISPFVVRPRQRTDWIRLLSSSVRKTGVSTWNIATNLMRERFHLVSVHIVLRSYLHVGFASLIGTDFLKVFLWKPHITVKCWGKSKPLTWRTCHLIIGLRGFSNASFQCLNPGL